MVASATSGLIVWSTFRQTEAGAGSFVDAGVDVGMGVRGEDPHPAATKTRRPICQEQERILRI